MKYNAAAQWIKLQKDLNELESDEELLIGIGKRDFVIREATVQDYKNHGLEASQ